MDVEIPANTTATVFVPASDLNNVTESGKILSKANGIQMKNAEDGYLVLNLGSGIYHFAVQKK